MRLLLAFGLALVLAGMIRWLAWYSTSGAYNGGWTSLWSFMNMHPKDSTVTACFS